MTDVEPISDEDLAAIRESIDSPARWSADWSDRIVLSLIARINAERDRTCLWTTVQPPGLLLQTECGKMLSSSWIVGTFCPYCGGKRAYENDGLEATKEGGKEKTCASCSHETGTHCDCKECAENPDMMSGWTNTRSATPARRGKDDRSN